MHTDEKASLTFIRVNPCPSVAKFASGIKSPESRFPEHPLGGLLLGEQHGRYNRISETRGDFPGGTLVDSNIVPSRGARANWRPFARSRGRLQVG